MALPIPVTFLFTKGYTRLCLVEWKHPPLLELYFHLKASAIPPALIERLGQSPFSEKCSMKRTGNMCVDRQWLSNVVLLWTVVKVCAQHGVHPTTLSPRISQVLSGFCLWKPVVVKDGFNFLNYITEGWLLVVYVLLCKCTFQCYYLLEETGMWFHCYGQNWLHHVLECILPYSQYCFNIILCEPMRKIDCYHNNLYIHIYKNLCIRVTKLELMEYRLER